MVKSVRQIWCKALLGILIFAKPHTAINHGDDERIHLVIDVESNEQLRDILRTGIEA